MSLACPIDNKDNTIQKVSAVVAGGTSTGSFSGLTSGVVDVDGKTGNLGGFSTLTGGTKSNLASFLASPRMPHQPSNMNLLIILGFNILNWTWRCWRFHYNFRAKK